MEFALIPRHTLESGESYSSEGRTAVTGWGDQLAGNAVAPYLDYGSDEKIEWIGGERDYDPKHFAELEKMKSEGADIYLPLALSLIHISEPTRLIIRSRMPSSA